MKKFIFSLETVLKIRKRNEESKLGLLSEVVSRINQFNQDILKNEEEIEHQNEAFMEYLQEGTTTHNFTVHQSFLKRLNQENEFYQKKIEDENENMNFARSEYIEANKQKKIIEILKEKRYKEYKDKILKFESLEMEEFNNNLLNKLRKAQRYGDKESGVSHYESYEDSEEINDKKQRSEYDKLQEYIKQYQNL